MDRLHEANDVYAHGRQRVTVKLVTVDPETCAQDEWAHADECEESEAGVLLDWGQGRSSFVPWQAVLRIDREPCTCAECRAVAKAAA
jgi:hypothetical protein